MLTVELVSRLSDEQIQELCDLSQTTWWGQGRQLADIRSMLDRSDIIVAFCETETRHLIGFARVLTDFTYRAVIFDVMVQESHRHQGLGQALMEAIWQHPRLQSVEAFILFCTPDVVPFYQKCGFTAAPRNTVFMARSHEMVL